MRICKVGGSESFLEILNTGNLKSPFEEETIKSVTIQIKDYLDKLMTANFKVKKALLGLFLLRK